uniref:VLRF1 domain-containing protein n=1 Tax=Tetradesmus obliquus TaxID=3088 RepID=A0A383V3M5_TETOB|eukprot:jgi/Sobl393_1/14333/SZX60198.1
MVGQGFVFHIPQDFFDSAECVGAAKAAEPELPSAADSKRRPAAATTAAADDEDEAAAASSSAGTGGWNEAGATCIACGIGISSQGFSSAAEQRQHFKMDWHRYNLKRRLEKKQPLSEQEFEALIEQGDDVSSISGSDTDSSDDSSDDEAGGSSSRRGRRRDGPAALQGAQAVFKSADGAAFAVWRCLLLPDKQHKQEEPSGQQLLQLLRQLRRQPNSTNAAAAAAAAGARIAAQQQQQQQQQQDAGGCIWMLLMLRGGHFAAAVVRINSSSSSSKGPRPITPPAEAAGGASAAGSSSSSQQQQQQQQQQRSKVQQPIEPFTVLAHKTFHRYVVRAKAGGKQSTKDASGKFARSAGSRLRRYNEAALQRDITALLKEWSPWLSAAQLIFLSAPGSNSRELFAAAADVGPLGAAAAGAAAAGGTRHAGVLDPGDLRVRRVPFVTQRPTFSELKRVLLVLGSLRPVQLLEDQQQQQQQQQGAAAEGQKEKQQQRQQQQQVAAVPVGSISPAGVTKKQEEPALVKASKAGDAERVARLLANGHDPTACDSKGRSPYQLAANKEVRDAFRRFMAAEPDAWDYAAADVPSPLTDEMESAQQSKKAEKKARQKAKEKQGGKAPGAAGSSSSSQAATAADGFDEELAAAMAEAAAISSRAAASSKGKQVGAAAGSSKRGGRPAAAAAARPSAEEAARKREQLAAAAEARLKALQQKQQLW